jgi:hypothetical protein
LSVQIIGLIQHPSINGRQVVTFWGARLRMCCCVNIHRAKGTLCCINVVGPQRCGQTARQKAHENSQGVETGWGHRSRATDGGGRLDVGAVREPADHLTFSGAVALPAVTLPTGSYTFELSPTPTRTNVVRVSAWNGANVLFTGLT